MLSGKYRAVFVTAASISIALLLISGVRWHGQRAAARSAVSELAACRTMAAKIESLRATPKSVSLAKQSTKQITQCIQQAAQAAEIADKVQLIAPQQERRFAKSSHVQQPTTVEISQTTLGQLSRFLNELSVMDVGLQPTSIRLTAPRAFAAENRTETWACELVLTYLVFSPE